MLLEKFVKQGLIHPPKWLTDNCMYLTIMGSQAYGVNTDNSDLDVYGFCIPPKHVLFPNLSGVIKGFGNQGEVFEQWSEHHIQAIDKKQEYDFSVYNIAKYFHLLMGNNPNIIDSIFTPRNCVIHSTKISEYVREHRKEFLHKGSWHTFKGYSYAMLSKIRNKTNASNPKRAETIKEFGYDLKFSYHLVRLLNEAEQILVEGDLDLQKNNEQLKSIRKGEWSFEQIENYFETKEKELESVYLNSKLPYSPDEKHIRQLLIDCLEMHFGSLAEVVKKDISVNEILKDLRKMVKKYE